MAGLKKIIVASIITLVRSSFNFPIKANPINYPKAIKPLLRSPLPNLLRVLRKSYQIERQVFNYQHSTANALSNA